MIKVSRALARVPLLALAMGCFAGVLMAERGGGATWAVVPLGLAILCLPIRRWRIASGLAGWAFLWFAHGTRIERRDAAAEWVRTNGRGEVEVEGVLLGLRDHEGFLPRGLFLISGGKGNPAGLRKAVVAVRNLADSVQPGDRLLLRGPIALPGPARNPGEFDRFDWMRTRGIAAELRAVRQEVSGRPSPVLALQRLAWILRLELRDRIVLGLEEEGEPAALIRGLVLGDRSTGGEELYGPFRDSGTLHVFAVSGLHVGLVGMLAWSLMRGLRVPRSDGLWAVLVLMWVYAFVTGLRPPAMRAALMASVFLLGFAVKRQPSMANSLLASIPPVLLLDSFQLRQAGFQLSYAVVAMIILLGPPLYRRMRVMVDGDPFLPRLLYTRRQNWSFAARQKGFGLLAVSLAAWIGSLPLIAAHFGMVTPVAVVASMVLVPGVFLILALALLGVLAGVLAEPLEVGMNRVNGVLTNGASDLARGFSALPGSHFQLRKKGGWPDGILVFDLWDGDGAIFCGAGDGVLIDGGAEDQFRRVVSQAMQDAGRTPQSLVLTHPDGGHVGGLGLALEEYGARQVLLPVRDAGSPGFGRLLERTSEARCLVRFGVQGARYPIADGVELEVLRVADPASGWVADERVMVLRLHWHDWRILITGDAGFETEMELLARGVDLKSDVWIMGRHRADLTGTVEFVQAVAPRVIVAAEQAYPEEERIPKWWAAAVGKLGIDLWSQRATGAVMMEVTPGELRLRSFVDPRREVVLTKEAAPR